MPTLWTPDDPARPVSAQLPPSTQEVVVGAGITGLTTALMLAERGRAVTVLTEAPVGVSNTAASTGKVSLLQARRLSQIRAAHPASLVRAYVDANRDGQQWLTEFAERAGVPLERRDAVTFATTEQHALQVADEATAAAEAGLPVELGDPGLPFSTTAAVRLPGQVQLDPSELVRALASAASDAGAVIVEGVRAVGVRAGGSSPIVHTTLGDLDAEAVVLATGTPILDRGLYFAKTEAVRSYLAAWEVDSAFDLPMSIGLDEPGITLRTASKDGRPYVVVGGGGHVVGRADPASDRVAAVIGWAAEHLGLTRDPAVVWSAQDYRSLDEIPFTGRLPRGMRRVWMATGYHKWGLALGVAAAKRITAEIMGDPWSGWMRAFGTRMTVPADIVEGAAAQAGVATSLAVGWTRALSSRGGAPEPPAEGAARVVTHRGKPVAVSTVDGRSCAVSGVCTHLGGIVEWNDVERTWDCPLHGSRFAPDGRRIEGPAVNDLKRYR